MDKVNIDYLMDIFRALSTELPEQMLYRENGDSIELRTLDSIENSIGSSIGSSVGSSIGNGTGSSIGNGGSAELQNGGWSLIGSQMIEAA